MALLLADLVRTVTGLLYRISEEGGPFLSDEDYIESVKYELDIRHLSYRQNETVELEYLEKIVDRHTIEFIVEDKILIDLKGRRLLRHRNFHRQLAAYLQRENLPLAFVVDFHSRRVEIRKVTNPNYNYQFV